MSTSRRTFAKNMLAATTAFSLPAFVTAGNPKKQNRKLKIVCVGGHPDDPESGCGGTLAMLQVQGHDVTIIYLTSGEAGIPGKSHAEAAAIRTKEAIAACKILNAKPIFAGQIDGAGMADNEWVGKIQELIKMEKPDIVFTHWPIDTHKDHQAASLLTIQSWVRLGKIFELYFFEVCTGSQTMGFKPTDYVDITNTKEQKKKAVFCHTSQNPPGIYAASDCNHGMMEIFRGIEINVAAAEAFVRMGTALNFG
ncbi:PIG-L deacetylase family protein [Ferruginibacter paludis]|uniref:PIG-L deacetylase family protein n=1 Tax=Ferruginibacter paludis TaxID=1310417 RepID=UPI0025B50ACC|nr:PIG-L deacetylase family protein [Ferruginibacter paludis]MDN3656353.1 PIG-L deacetylase family protein [Ferruginibacter paludis]